MLDFKPSNPAGDLVESSDDLEGGIGITEESEDSDISDDSDSDDIDAEEIDDVGEESGRANDKENPFFNGNDSDVSDTDDESDLEDEPKPDAVDEEDDLIKALKAAREKKERNSPPDIKTSELITDISFHPEADVIALGNISGELSVFKYSNESNTIQKKLKLSKKTLRGLEFDDSGSSLLTISKDKSLRILDTETWTVKHKYVKCHDSPLYSCASLDPNISVTGDEDGFVKMWDNRQGDTSIMTFKRFDEFVSSFLKIDSHHLIAASGEGTIQSFDLRQKKPDIQSEMYDGELNCMGTVRSGTKLVVGSGTGPLYLFSKDQYGLHSDQFPGHPDGVNALIPITDNVVITGCEDGNIRAVHLYPHRFLGVIGHHEDEFPIERLDVNTTGEMVASISHDNRVKFWNVTYQDRRWSRVDSEITPKFDTMNMSRTVARVARANEVLVSLSGSPVAADADDALLVPLGKGETLSVPLSVPLGHDTNTNLEHLDQEQVNKLEEIDRKLANMLKARREADNIGGEEDV